MTLKQFNRKHKTNISKSDIEKAMSNPRYEMEMGKCKKGDILISKLGNILVYNSYYTHRCYPHIVYYLADVDLGTMEISHHPKNCRGSRNNDGSVFKKERIPETDNDITLILK